MNFKGVENEPLTTTASLAGAGLAFNHPDELLSDCSVSKSVKRALLADWASDRHAIEGAPALRQLASGAVVRLDEILEALKALDGGAIPTAPPLPSRPAYRLLRRPIPSRRARPGDDDDPPRPIRMRLRGGAGVEA